MAVVVVTIMAAGCSCRERDGLKCRALSDCSIYPLSWLHLAVYHDVAKEIFPPGNGTIRLKAFTDG